MSRTPSNMIPLGTIAPDFTLFDTVTSKNVSLKNLKGSNATVIFFICNHCPFVIHINDELVKIANDYNSKGISFIAISSNDVENYPQDSPELMKKVAEQQKYPFPYLYDNTQEVAKLYDAACTPDFYIFDSDLKLTYRGQLDDSRPGNGVGVNGKNLRFAIECILNDKPNTKIQRKSIGCNIKFK
jgi:peroxiredoxin